MDIYCCHTEFMNYDLASSNPVLDNFIIFDKISFKPFQIMCLAGQTSDSIWQSLF